MHSGNSQADGNGCLPGSSGFSKAVAPCVPTRCATTKERSAMKVWSCTMRLCTADSHGTPYSAARVRKGGGPGRRNRARDHVLHGNPLMKMANKPASAIL
eukprot:864527-Alexandrium_andersonii.AAC.1